MEMCATCALELDPKWKFCIRCGTAVPERSELQTAVEPSDVVPAPAPAPAVVPTVEPVMASMIAPPPPIEIPSRYPLPPSSPLSDHFEYTDDGAAPDAASIHPKRKLNIPLMVSIGLSTAGVILIVYLAIVIFGARG